MRTLFRFTTLRGRNLLTAAVGRDAVGNVLFIWLLANGDCARCFRLYPTVGFRVFYFDAAFERRWPSLQFHRTREAISATWHHGHTGTLFVLGRVYNGKLFGIGDSRFATAFDKRGGAA